MCDTFVALPDATEDGSLIFAKNSDRDMNEAQEVVRFPAQDHVLPTSVQCTYISIPQVKHTRAVILSRPFWMWGAEMGANDAGVRIGNEAIFSKIPASKENRLLGMDLLRLGLERSGNAQEALKVITTLLETFGQGGNCGFAHTFYYHNSFLITDNREAWILETVDKQWAAKKVVSVGSISNGLTIENDWDLRSTDLILYAIDHKLCKSSSDFNFKKCYSDFLYTFFSDSLRRRECTKSKLTSELGKINLRMAIKLLQSHKNSSPNWTPANGIVGADICMHHGYGPIRGSQTTGSMISHSLDGEVTHWLTGTSTPCTSIYKPFWIEQENFGIGSSPKGVYDSESLWWLHEKIYRRIMMDYQGRIKDYSISIKAIQDEILNNTSDVPNMNLRKKENISVNAINLSKDLDNKWVERFNQMGIVHDPPFYYKAEIRKINQEARLLD